VIISTETLLIQLVHCHNEFVICWFSTFTAVCDIRDVSFVKELLINCQTLWHVLMVCKSAYSKKRKSLGCVAFRNYGTYDWTLTDEHSVWKFSHIVFCSQ
jgi:hypothetical protein